MNKLTCALCISITLSSQVMADVTLDLVGDWQITALDSAAALPDVEAIMSFSEDGQFSAMVGCNRAAGSYKLDETGLSFGPLAATRMMCPDEIMAQEDAFFRLMDRSADYRVEGEVVEILDDQGNTLVSGKR